MKTSFAIWVLWTNTLFFLAIMSASFLSNDAPVVARFVFVAFLGVNIAAGVMLNEKDKGAL